MFFLLPVALIVAYLGYAFWWDAQKQDFENCIERYRDGGLSDPQVCLD
jgi:hypothetical protein